MIGVVAGYQAALETGRQMGISDEDYDSWEENEAYVTEGTAGTRADAQRCKRQEATHSDTPVEECEEKKAAGRE